MVPIPHTYFPPNIHSPCNMLETGVTATKEIKMFFFKFFLYYASCNCVMTYDEQNFKIKHIITSFSLHYYSFKTLS
jgi:hypothetical protein